MSEQRADSISEAHAVYGQSELRTIPPIERLISSGRLKAATVDLLKLGRPVAERRELSISEALSEQRYGLAYDFVRQGSVSVGAVGILGSAIPITEQVEIDGLPDEFGFGLRVRGASTRSFGSTWACAR